MTSYLRVGSVFLSLVLLAAAAPAADSPQFRGPERNGIFPAEGLLASWPEGGPEKLWSASGLGGGFSSVSVADGRIYTTGMDGGEGYVLAFDIRGKALWKRGYGALHDGNGYPGTRTTPTYHEGLLYLMSSKARAVALDAATGEIRWHKDLASAFGARNITWGIAESPLVVDDKVIFTPGGSGATMVALDKKSGEELWTTSDIGDGSAYCSPLLLDDGKHRQIVTNVEKHIIGVDPAGGELLWQQPYPGRWDIHAVSPVFDGDSIFVSSGYKQGGKMFALATDGRGVSLRWKNESLDVHHGGAVLVDGRIYGAASNGAWYALEAATGKIAGRIDHAGKGSVVYADGRLYGYVEVGDVLLVDPDPANFHVVSSFRITEGQGQHWAHPVIADGVLYVRHGDVLMAFDVAGGG